MVYKLENITHRLGTVKMKTFFTQYFKTFPATPPASPVSPTPVSPTPVSPTVASASPIPVTGTATRPPPIRIPISKSCDSDLCNEFKIIKQGRLIPSLWFCNSCTEKARE